MTRGEVATVRQIATAPVDLHPSRNRLMMRWAPPDLFHVFAWACLIVIFACMIIGVATDLLPNLPSFKGESVPVMPLIGACCELRRCEPVEARVRSIGIVVDRTLGKHHRYDRVWTSPLFLFMFTQNPQQNTGLWAFGIPTCHEYGHMIMKGIYNFTKELLTDHQTRFNYRVIRAYELVPDVLSMLQVRFVLSDAAVDMPDTSQPVGRLRSCRYNSRIVGRKPA
jgi:hypothetical protein